MYTKIVQNQKYGQTSIDNITETGFTVNVGTKDELSGIGKYKYYIVGDGKTQELDDTKNQRVITGLKKETSYQVHVRVYDKAGNYAETVTIPVTTGREQSGTGEVTNPGLKAPIITNEGGTDWKQSKTVSIQILPGYTTMYTLDGTDPTATNGTSVTGPITLYGPRTVKACYVSPSNDYVSAISSLSVEKIDSESFLISDISTHPSPYPGITTVRLGLSSSGVSDKNGTVTGISDCVQVRYEGQFSGTMSQWLECCSAGTNYCEFYVPLKWNSIECNWSSYIEIRDAAGNVTSKRIYPASKPMGYQGMLDETVMSKKIYYSADYMDYRVRLCGTDTSGVVTVVGKGGTSYTGLWNVVIGSNAGNCKSRNVRYDKIKKTYTWSGNANTASKYTYGDFTFYASAYLWTGSANTEVRLC